MLIVDYLSLIFLVELNFILFYFFLEEHGMCKFCLKMVFPRHFLH